MLRESTQMGDLNALTFDVNTRDSVVAIGVTAWVRALTPALPEAARVLQRGLDCEVVAGNRGIGIHRMLQRLADRKIPLVRAMGFHYLVLATKLA